MANRAFRRCFQEGLNLIPYYARFNKINPLKCENSFYTMKGICYNSKGTDYVDLVAKELGIDGEKYDGKTMIHLRKSTADSIAALKKQAMDELSAVGVTFPVKVPFFFVAGNTVQQDNATVLKQCFTDSFGDDLSSRALSSTAGAPTSATPSTSSVRRSCMTPTPTMPSTTPTSPSWRRTPPTTRRSW